MSEVSSGPATGESAGALGEVGGEVADGVSRGLERVIGQAGRTTGGLGRVLDGIGGLGQDHDVEAVHVVESRRDAGPYTGLVGARSRPDQRSSPAHSQQSFRETVWRACFWTCAPWTARWPGRTLPHVSATTLSA